MRIHLLGTRGSLPAPGARFLRYGGNTSCVAIAHDGAPPSLILDAGSGLRSASSLLDHDAFRGSILLSHLHWDHVLGLPFFSAGDSDNAHVDLYLPAQGDPYELLGRIMSPPIFPIDVRGLRGNWTVAGLESGAHTIEGFTVLALDIPHKGGRSFGFRIDDGSGSVAYLPDHSPITLGEGPNGHGEYHEAAMRLVAGVDLMIHDSQYTTAEFVPRRHWGHCTYHYPVELARNAGVKRTLLFHHDPGRTDADMDALTTEIDDPSITFAVEGDTIDLHGSGS